MTDPHLRLSPKSAHNTVATIVIFMRENKLPTPTRSPLFAGTSMLLLCASFLHAQATPATGNKKMTRMTDPAQVHSSAIVIDTHADTPQRFVDEH